MSPIEAANQVIPDVPEPIIAYKILYVVPEDRNLNRFDLPPDSMLDADVKFELESRHWHFRWPPDTPVTAECRSNFGHPCKVSPGHICTSTSGDGCGIYAYNFVPGLPAIDVTLSGVIAEVLLWGKVYEYEFGYRAQYAQVNQILQLLRPVQDLGLMTSPLDIRYSQLSRSGYAISHRQEAYELFTDSEYARKRHSLELFNLTYNSLGLVPFVSQGGENTWQKSGSLSGQSRFRSLLRRLGRFLRKSR